ncbi:Do family serine endopeptidase [Nitrosomonas sp.]|uniref:Do family serine endopeptidase n=1 Tax=Nitrosomonas sp. TaxID=42353 RepID=UPI0028456573|nr:Do family serine endopeptidase [Nitrosomonas sp.]MCP5243813.1 Do family serine endopeptidase [Burkholderiales bacterium]MCP5292746.1 Do family serine endopeptidase [Burkholderiales bacterium]MDR4515398.1 Do family serine endopeptidase [Nitrosomonas sp.]
MYRLWLIFAQTATILLAIFFVISTLRPELLPWTPRGELVTIKEAAPSYAESRPDSYYEAASRAMPSVVNIFTRQAVKETPHPLLNDPIFQRFFGEQFEPRTRRRSNLGSGVIVSANGYILTNHHVIEAAEEVEVALSDGRKIEAKVIGSDPETDLAVLKIELQNLPTITFGQSALAKVGDVVLAVGNPFGVGQSVTMGIIGALGRTKVGINTFEDFIQTDAAINPGNSGGALTDTDGNLIGINTAIYSQSGGSLGIGFAIPIHIAKEIMEQIIQSGTVIRGWLGVSMQDMTKELADSFNLDNVAGALIASVLKDGPSDKAGIKPGDIMIAIEGESIENSSELLNKVAGLSPGKIVTVTIIRNKEEKNIEIKVGVRPKQM